MQRVFSMLYKNYIIEIYRLTKTLKEYVKNLLSNEFKEVEFILSSEDINPFKCF